MEDGQITLIRNYTVFGKELFYHLFVTYLNNSGVNTDEYVFMVFNAYNGYGENGGFLIENLVPYLDYRGIPYEVKNLDAGRGEMLPPLIKLSAIIDSGNSGEKLHINAVEHLCVLSINYESNERIFVFYPDIVYESREGHFSPVFIAARDRNRSEVLIREVYAFSRKQMREKSGYIFNKDRHFKSRPKANWDDLILPDELKKDIRRNIELFFNGMEFFKRNFIPYKRGFLFVGPPGNGKSLLCRVIAGSYPEIPFIYYQQGNMDLCYALEKCFELAASLSPSILCIEDIDVIIKEQNLSLLLNLIDGLSENEGILLIATTNHPEKLDQNILNRPSRFDRIWLISPPDEEMRLRILKKFMGNFFDDGTLKELARMTDGFSMAYMKELFISSFINAIEKGHKQITQDDIHYAMNMLKKQLIRGNNYYEKSKQLGFLEGTDDSRSPD